MNCFKFRCVLVDSRSNKKQYFDWVSRKDDYLSAWKETVEFAWGELNSHDKYWYIKEIIDINRA